MMSTFNQKKLPPSTKRIDYLSAIVGSTLAGVTVASATLWLGWHDLPFLPKPIEPISMHLRFCVKGALAILSNGFFGADDWYSYQAYYAQLSELGKSYILTLRAGIAGLTGLGAAYYTFSKLAIAHDHLIHVRGRQLYQDQQAILHAVKDSQREIAISGQGILLHPELPISLDRESRHTMIMGGVGSGKTQVMWHLINQAINRGDRVIIYDNKGDFTENIQNLTLIAPWDSRSEAWDIGADCRNKQDARELAARLIPGNDKDPMWSNASRSVLTGLIVYLQSNKGTAWGFRDLANLLPEPIERIQEIMKLHNPDGLRCVEEASKTTQSILINLSAFMQVIYDLADAWSDDPLLKKISLSRWLDNEAESQTLLLQGSGQYGQLTKAYINAMISMFSAHVSSPTFSNDTQRRIWVFLDELPQLGKVEHLAPLMEIGRSKGIRVVLGTQDAAQLQAIYGQDGTNAWTSMIGTSIYGRIQGGNTAQSIAKRIGDREVERPNEVSSNQGDQTSSSLSYTREVLPIILPSQLLTDLGTTTTGVKVIIDGFAEGVYLLEYPYAKLDKKREASIIAAWVQSKSTQPNPEAATQQAEPSIMDGTAMEVEDTATAVGSENSTDNSTDNTNTNARKRLKRREEYDGQQEEWS